MNADMEQVPGFLFFDHVAISVKPGELESNVKAYQAMGFKEVHREDVLGGDQVREVLLQVGGGPNLVQLLEPLNAASPVAKLLEKNGGRGGLAHVALRVADIQNQESMICATLSSAGRCCAASKKTDLIMLLMPSRLMSGT